MMEEHRKHSERAERRSQGVERFFSQADPFDDRPSFTVIPVLMPADPFVQNPRRLWGAMIEIDYPDGRKRSEPVEFDSGLVLDASVMTAMQAGQKRIDNLLRELEEP